MECFAHLFFLAFVGASSAFRIAFPFPPNTVQSTPTAQAGGPVITRLAALFVDAPVKNMQGASYGFLGCFIESAESYIGSVVVTLPLMTPETCSNFCLTWNYFSLARGTDCICSAQQPSVLTTDVSNCNIPCSGNATETCGANGYLQSYEKQSCSSDSCQATPSPTPVESTSSPDIFSPTDTPSITEASSNTDMSTAIVTILPATSSTKISSLVLSPSSVNNSTSVTLQPPEVSPTGSTSSVLTTSLIAESSAPSQTSSTALSSNLGMSMESPLSRQMNSPSGGTTVSATSTQISMVSSLGTTSSSSMVQSSSYSSTSTRTSAVTSYIPSRISSSSNVTPSSITHSNSLIHTSKSTLHTSIHSSSSSSTLKKTSSSSIKATSKTSTTSIINIISSTRSSSSSPHSSFSTRLAPLTSASRVAIASTPSTHTTTSTASISPPTPTPASVILPTTTTFPTTTSSVLPTTTSKTTSNGPPGTGLLLSSPTPLMNTSGDESQTVITLPFNLTLYTQTSPNISVTSNGLLAIVDTEYVDNGYVDQPEPLYTLDLVPGTAMPWWQYMYSNGQGQSGIYYQIDGGNHLSVEWYLYNYANQLCHFIATYSSLASGNINFYYLSNGDTGTNSTIGVQGLDASGDEAWLQATAETPGTVSAGSSFKFSTSAGSNPNGTFTSNPTFNPGCYPSGTWPAGTCGTPAT